MPSGSLICSIGQPCQNILLGLSPFTFLLGSAGEGGHVPPAQDHCQRSCAALERPHERLRLYTAAAAPQICEGVIAERGRLCSSPPLKLHGPCSLPVSRLSMNKH